MSEKRSLLLIGLIAILITALLYMGSQAALTEYFILDAAKVRGGEWWRLLTGHYVHFGSAHFLFNYFAFLMLLAWAVVGQSFRNFAVFIVLATIPLSLVLMFLGVDWYAGSSGILHGAIVLLLLDSPPTLRMLGLIAVFGKLLVQFFLEHSFIGSQGIVVIQEAHWAGALLAFVFYFVFELLGWNQFRNKIT